MPAFYKIDKARRLVLSSGTGVFSREDALSHQNPLLADRDFDPSFSQLLDFTHITHIELGTPDIQQLALRNIFSPDSRRAILVSNDLAFGFGRMYGILRESAGEHGIRVFRTLEEALEWILSRHEAP
jgi:hypothetical protein